MKFEHRIADQSGNVNVKQIFRQNSVLPREDFVLVQNTGGKVSAVEKKLSIIFHSHRLKVFTKNCFFFLLKIRRISANRNQSILV